jgi:hypothetical protein
MTRKRTSSTATKTNPRLWESSKRRACSKAKLCKHSARKMQWATRDYKQRGGLYASPRKSPSNSLTKWTRQRWRTHSGKKSKGTRRYLPDAAWSHLTPAQIRRTNAAKRAGYQRGKQWVPQPRDVVNVVREFRNQSPR